jgi:NADPH:quinone reductase-like Zn-dependent oxidoreductase
MDFGINLAPARESRSQETAGMALIKARAIGVNFADTRLRQGVDLAQAAEAHRYLESRQSTGKLVLLP